jgi:hypothetical protein
MGMSGEMDRERLIELVENIMQAKGSEEEIDEWIAILKQSVPHPEVTNLIFYPEDEGVTPEEIVDAALSYQPIQLGPGKGAE